MISYTTLMIKLYKAHNDVVGANGHGMTLVLSLHEECCAITVLLFLYPIGFNTISTTCHSTMDVILMHWSVMETLAENIRHGCIIDGVSPPTCRER
jgi:hypothetical protein